MNLQMGKLGFIFGFIFRERSRYVLNLGKASCMRYSGKTTSSGWKLPVQQIDAPWEHCRQAYPRLIPSKRVSKWITLAIDCWWDGYHAKHAVSPACILSTIWCITFCIESSSNINEWFLLVGEHDSCCFSICFEPIGLLLMGIFMDADGWSLISAQPFSCRENLGCFLVVFSIQIDPSEGSSEFFGGVNIGRISIRIGQNNQDTCRTMSHVQALLREDKSLGIQETQRDHQIVQEKWDDTLATSTKGVFVFNSAFGWVAVCPICGSLATRPGRFV